MLIALLSALLSHCGPTISPDAVTPGSDFHGTVVDWDTGEPLADAVLIVHWNIRPIVSMDGGDLHRVAEGATDERGRFAVCECPGISLHGVITEPGFRIFAPGYETFPGRAVWTDEAYAREWDHGSTTEIGRKLRAGAVVKLRRLTSRGDAKSLAYSFIREDLLHCLPEYARLLAIHKEMVRDIKRWQR